MNELTIGELAEACAIHRETIRYYERMELMPEPERNSSGYRIYQAEMVERIQFIKRMQDMGFTLKEIGTFLDISDGRAAMCCDMTNFAVSKLEEIRQKIEDLQRIEQLLTKLTKCCENQNETVFNQCQVITELIHYHKR